MSDRSPPALFMGVDVGTSGARALVMDAAGQVVGAASESYDLKTPHPGWAEQDPDDWFDAACRAMSRALTDAGRPGAAVVAVGLTGQMHSTVFLDAADRPLRPAILWCDQRAAGECDKLTRRAGGLDELLRMTANRALAGFTAPKILWVRDREPALFDRVRTVLVSKDYVRLRLTGEKASEVTDASGTLLFDVRKRRVSTELLGRLGLEPSLLARVVESSAVTGEITAEAARRCGLQAGTPVVGGAGDQAAAAVGCGVIHSGVASISLGTSGVVFAASDTPLDDPCGGLHVFCHAMDDLWHAMGVTLSAGGAIRWWRDVIAYQSDRGGRSPGYHELDEEAAGVPAGAQGLIFLPYLCGERTPIHDAEARGVFYGLSLAHGRSQMTRAVLEGVCLALRSNVELLRSRGVALSEIRLTGGGARSPLLRQMLADVIDSPLVLLEVDEGPALGAALLAAVGVGAFAGLTEACGQAVSTAGRVKPSGENRDIYRSLSARFDALYESVRAMWGSSP